MDHADHVFWLGVRVSDWSLPFVPPARHTRSNGAASSRAAPRSCQPPLDPPERTLSRGQAKRRLGLPEASLVLLSVARAIKFRTIGGERYADMFLPFLKACPNAALVIVGPGERSDWQDAIARTGGRIRLYPETLHTKTLFEAADIYVDSYPFVSTTSLLESDGRKRVSTAGLGLHPSRSTPNHPSAACQHSEFITQYERNCHALRNSSGGSGLRNADTP